MALAFALVAALLLPVAAPSIAALRYPDPDDVLRLVQVRDLLAGQGWFDLTPAPARRAERRGADALVAAGRHSAGGMILLLTPLLGQPLAEHHGGRRAVADARLRDAAGRAAGARLCGAETVPYACLALALSVPVLSQFLPLRIDHHGWQIVLALAALAGVMARRCATGRLDRRAGVGGVAVDFVRRPADGRGDRAASSRCAGCAIAARTRPGSSTPCSARGR